MSQKPEYDRGYQDGVRAAVTWLHKRAKEMGDPHAQRVLDSAATNLGWDHSRRELPQAPADRPVP